MMNVKYEYQSEFARKYFFQGEAAGLQKGEALALLEVLDARGLPISAVARRRILACTDPDQLKRWIRQAATATSVKEFLGTLPNSTCPAR